VAALMHETPDTYETGGAPFNADTKVGIAVRKDNPALKAMVEKAVQAMVKDGTYDALLKKWAMPAGSSAF
jgi:polar amino acid transport system substrate-binding protein